MAQFVNLASAWPGLAWVPGATESEFHFLLAQFEVQRASAIKIQTVPGRSGAVGNASLAYWETSWIITKWAVSLSRSLSVMRFESSRVFCGEIANYRHITRGIKRPTPSPPSFSPALSLSFSLSKSPFSWHRHSFKFLEILSLPAIYNYEKLISTIYHSDRLQWKGTRNVLHKLIG